MLERGILTAAVAVVIISALGALAQQFQNFSNELRCSLSGEAVCVEQTLEEKRETTDIDLNRD